MIAEPVAMEQRPPEPQGKPVKAERQARRPAVGKGQQGGVRANPLGRPGAALPQLTGIAQVIGLALGSPEFQRR